MPLIGILTNSKPSLAHNCCETSPAPVKLEVNKILCLLLRYQNTTIASWPVQGQMICLGFYPHKNVIALSFLPDQHSVPVPCLFPPTCPACAHLLLLHKSPAKTATCVAMATVRGGANAPERESGGKRERGFALLSPPCRKQQLVCLRRQNE